MISVFACFNSNLLHDGRIVTFRNDYASNQVKLVEKSPWLAKNHMLTKSSKELEDPDSTKNPIRAWISHRKNAIYKYVILPKTTTLSKA